MTTGARLSRQYGALDAFLPAVLAFGGEVDRAKRLEESCFKMWTLQGIEPEVIDYTKMTVVVPGYPLRPEIIESAYYLYRYTKDPRYLEMGRAFLEAIVARCRTDDGYAILKNVVTGERGDLMPSFFFAETLKYLFLIFAPDDAVDFDRVVFNTEAHPFKRAR
jgi:mannosidase alpha-like ER degradation enhancer 2